MSCQKRLKLSSRVDECKPLPTMYFLPRVMIVLPCLIGSALLL